MNQVKSYSVKILSCALIFLVMLLGSPICAVETIGEPTAYPDKPQNVVKAFIEAGLRSNKSTEEMRLCDEVLEAQNRYFPDHNDEKQNLKTRVLNLGEPWGHCLNKYHIVTGYEIKAAKVSGNKAAIEVTYKRLGWIWFSPQYLKECNDQHNKITDATGNKLVPMNSARKKKDKGECKFLHITEDTNKVLYHLAKPGRFWRITDCCEPHVSVESAIKILECQITERKSVSKTYPSEEQKRMIRRDIEDLKNVTK
jgi:hypothetical protein